MVIDSSTSGEAGAVIRANRSTFNVVLVIQLTMLVLGGRNLLMVWVAGVCCYCKTLSSRWAPVQKLIKSFHGK